MLKAEEELLSSELKVLNQQLADCDKKVIPVIPLFNYSVEDKINIFMSLFRGRADVFAKRWENLKTGKRGYSPVCNNDWVYGKCYKPQIKCSECKNQAFIPLTPDKIRNHLGGLNSNNSKQDYTIGIYPLLENDSCWFLAVDFDKENWQKDIQAFSAICKSRGLPVYIERSRSGKGGHLWFFFSQPIPAILARKMGTLLLTETMNTYIELGFESYDRFFPNQDTRPIGGFGNLIALPLQHFPRRTGNSTFLDENFEPYPDQWALLASVEKITLEEINKIISSSSIIGNGLGLKIPASEEDSNSPWELLPSREVAKETAIATYLLPKSITIVLSNQLFIAKQDITPQLMSKILRLAAFQNPEFYKAQAMRLPVFDKPRVIACAENFSNHIGLPRGCLDECIELLKSLGVEPVLDDKRNFGTTVKLKFLGQLTKEQKLASKSLLDHDTGVLSATTGFGKTVIGASMISKRKVNTLIIVHRIQLLEQWVERLKMFLNVTAEQIGIIGGGKHKPSGIIDIAVIQSLIKKNTVNNIVANYGQVIVDECHHLSAVSFEAVVKECKAKYFLGLTATPTRKDGHQPIIFMQCGPIRYTVDAKKQAQLRSFDHKVIIKNTIFNFSTIEDEKVNISQIYAGIIINADRNMLIINDVINALKAGRNPLILTERKEHVIYFSQAMAKFCKNIIVMVGGQTAKQRKDIHNQLASISENEERLIIATGKYIGEGFDDKRLDTLFLTLPISWHGTVAQYAGRLHRENQAKQEVIIYDYVDINVPMLARMAEKRRKGYLNLGYSLVS